MPVPTDTFWNIKRLNRWFALSAVVLLLTMVVAVLQDYEKTWRGPQRNGRTWEAAIADYRAARALTPQEQKHVDELKSKIEALDAQLKDNKAINDLQGQIRDKESKISNLQFDYNNRKATIGVQLGAIQDAKASGNFKRANEIAEEIKAPNARLAADDEQIKAWKDDVAELRKQLAQKTADRDAAVKEKTKLEADRDAMLKKRKTLEPDSLAAKLSAKIRAAPLMQFINPSEKVQQIVLQDVQTDVAFQKIATIDRCTTCHVNIDKREFTEPNMRRFLEEEVAHSRGLKLPAVREQKAAYDATFENPGAVAAPEFWHNWAVELSPASVRKSAKWLKNLADTVGPLADVTYDGKKVTAPFIYDVTQTDPQAIERQNAIVAELLKAWPKVAKYDPLAKFDPKDRSLKVTSAGPKASVTLRPPTGDASKAAKLGTDAIVASLKYPEEIREALEAQLTAIDERLLLDRYRRELTAELNLARDKNNQAKLDDSRVLLAHPRLDLYVDIDSKHSMESVGCTSCHDGSGQETDFVLAAHTPRQIWVDDKTGAPVLAAQLTNPPEEHHEATMDSMLHTVYPPEQVLPEDADDLHFKIAHGGDAKTTEHADAGEKASTHVPETSDPIAYRDPVTGRDAKAVPQGQYWAGKYERESGTNFKDVNHYWDWPMRPVEFLQANCVRCHTQVSDIREEAPVVYEGRTLFANLGCVNCHQMDSIKPDIPPVGADPRAVLGNGQRKVGTDLRHINAKLSPSFINSWVWAPKAFRPSTKMPHFFMLENNSSEEELRRTKQEARAITEYLVQTASPYEIKHTPEKSLKGNLDNGRLVFETIGCQGCHTNLNNPSKTKGVTVGQQWITTDLAKSGELAKELDPQVRQKLQKDLNLKLTKNGKAPTEDELRQEVEKQLPKELDTAVKAEAKSRYEQMDYNERQLYVLEHMEPPSVVLTATPALPGEAKPQPTLLNERKYPDGTPKPVFSHHGPELSGIGTKLLSDRTPAQARAWLYDWLKEPRHYSEYTVMPQLRLSDQQAIDLVEYLLAQKRTNDKADDPWKAHLGEVDSAKQIELTAFFLRSRFSTKTAVMKADDDKELTELATEALTTQVVDAAAAAERVKSLDKDQKRMLFLGKKLVSHYGCMSCHAINGAEALTSPCANLSDWGQKAVSKLDFAYLDPHRVHDLPEAGKHTKIPMVNGLSAHATELLAPATQPSTPVAEAGHDGVGTGQVVAEHQKSGSVSQNVEVAWPHLDHTRVSWITQKLKNTRIYDRGKALYEPGTKKVENGLLEEPGKPYDKLKMPTFYLNDEQVHAITTFVISNRDRLISERLLAKSDTDRSRLIAQGRVLTQKYNCVNCHLIEGNVPGVQQYYAKDELTTKAPPSLRGEGNKIQHDWLFNFLRNVEKLRPIPVIRMPSFPLTADESTAIAAYFASVSNKEAQDLAKALDPVAKYRQTARRTAAAAALAKASTQPTTNASTKPSVVLVEPKPDSADTMGLTPNPGLGDDWYKQPSLQSTRERLTRLALTPERQWVNENQIDPLKNSDAELAKNFKTLLFKALFTDDLYKTPYPLSESGVPDVSDPSFESRFKLGEKLFYEMQCLQCHVMNGKRPNELTEADIKAAAAARAPNLGLAHVRLQRRWVRHWVQEPPVIQVGTAMPAFFTGIVDRNNQPVFSVIGNSWPRTQVTLRPAEQIEADYGKTVDDQTKLLLDFVFAAGARNHIGVQPPTGAAPQPLPPGPPQTPSTPDTGGEPSKESPSLAPVEKAPSGGPQTMPAEKDAEFERKAAPVKEGAAAPAKQPDAKADEKKTAPPADAKASITGKVVFDGQPPQPRQIEMDAKCAQRHADPVNDETLVVNADKTLRNVVVFVSEGLPAGATFNAPAEPVVLDQNGCRYEPHVVALMAGQPLLIKSSDPWAHNVHTFSEKNPTFNLSQGGVNDGDRRAFREAEYFRVKCDVHPWMNAMISVMENPYFSVTGDKGTFSISDLPPGKYTLTARHEALGDQQQEVTVVAGKPVEVSFSFAPPEANAARRSPVREVLLSSR